MPTVWLFASELTTMQQSISEQQHLLLVSYHDQLRQALPRLSIKYWVYINGPV